MQIQENTYLRYTGGNSDKIYLVMVESDGEGFALKFGYCRFGKIPTFSYKLVNEKYIIYDRNTIFDLYYKLIKSKERKGYEDQIPQSYMDQLVDEGLEKVANSIQNIINPPKIENIRIKDIKITHEEIQELGDDDDDFYNDLL